MTEPAGAASGRVSIVLADDHAVVRRGLRLLLALEDGLHVVGEATGAEGALDLVRDLRPDVVVLDLNMPGQPALTAIPELRAAHPAVAIVVMTMEADPAIAQAALGAGASGYVLKDAAEAELVAAIRAVLAGRTYLDPGLGARLASTGAQGRSTASPGRAAPEPELGSTFAEHRIEGVAGRGGMAVVYRATDLALDRTVALKLIAPAVAQDPAFRRRFDRERRLAATVDHPRVVPVYRAGEEDGRLYLTMRYIDGSDLRRVLVADGRLDAPRATGIVTQVAQALDAAHRHGLVHRDVKPGNILLARREGEGEAAYLTDFGVSRARAPAGDTALTRPGMAVGTPDYMAPEQVESGDVDARADVYSLACVLFHALSGAVPYERGSDLEKLYAHAHQPPPALATVRPDLPPAVDEVLQRGLAKDPRDRPPSAGVFARECAVALAGA